MVAPLIAGAVALAKSPAVWATLASLAPMIYSFFESDAPDKEKALKIKQERDKLASELAGAKGISIEDATNEVNARLEPIIKDASSDSPGKNIANLIGVAGGVGLGAIGLKALRAAKAAKAAKGVTGTVVDSAKDVADDAIRVPERLALPAPGRSEKMATSYMRYPSKKVPIQGLEEVERIDDLVVVPERLSKDDVMRVASRAALRGGDAKRKVDQIRQMIVQRMLQEQEAKDRAFAMAERMGYE